MGLDGGERNEDVGRLTDLLSEPVDHVDWDGTVARLQVGEHGVVVQSADSGPLFAQAGEFSIGYVGKELDEGLSSVLDRMAGRLADVAFDDFVAALPAGPEDRPDVTERPVAPEPGRTRVPDEVELDGLPELLGVAPPDARTDGPQLVAASWWRDQLLVEFDGPGLNGLVAYLQPPGDGRTGLASTDHLLFCYEGDQITPTQAAFIRELAERCADVTFDALREAFVYVPTAHDPGDPLADVTSGMCGSSPTDPGSGDDAVSRAWRARRQWYAFTCAQVVDRMSIRSIDLNPDGIYLEHGDLECRFAAPDRRLGVPSFVNYPWKLDRQPKFAADHPKLDPDTAGGFLTNLDDADLVLGGVPKLAELFDEVGKAFPEAPLHFNLTCPPIVIADSVNPEIRKLQRDRSAPVVFTTQDPGSPVSKFSAMLQESMSSEQMPTDRTINLVGFRPGRDRDELIADLGASGVAVNLCVVPENPPGIRDQYGRASLQVFFPNGAWQGLYRHSFDKLSIASVQPDAPFGFRATEQWLADVAAGVGLPPEDAAAAAAERRASLADEWDAAREAVRGSRLGIVTSDLDFGRLVDPRRLMGVPLFEFLAELGFDLDLMVHAGSPDVARDCRDIAARLPGDHRVEEFDTRDQLAALLRRPEFGAVFSEYYYDKRLAQAGKGQFNVSDLERGFAGAVRTAQRLLDRGSVPFYARYGRYLDRGSNVGGA